LKKADIEKRDRGLSAGDKLIWNIREIIADLSLFYHLHPGDLIFTGTPEGVGPLQPGDLIEGSVVGVGEITLKIGPAE